MVGSTKILVGDALVVLKTLPSESVHCVVTSPPYYGLRDYGTGQWEGGDPKCDHIQRTAEDVHKTSKLGSHHRGHPTTNAAYQAQQRQFSVRCNKCGARRIDQQIGLEQTPDAYIARLVDVFHEVRRVLRKDGTAWLVLGDSFGSGEIGRHDYASGRMIGPKRSQQKERQQRPRTTKPKDLLMIPARVALALQADGWWLRSDIIWHAPNKMPESVTDRPTHSHEHVFLLAKSQRYYFDAAAVAEPLRSPKHPRTKNNGESAVDTKMRGFNGACGTPNDVRNIRDVWIIPTTGFSEAHFAAYPPKLVALCVKAGCPRGGVVLDPFIGSGTTGMVANRLGRNCIGIDLNPKYARMAQRRIIKDAPLFADASVES